MAATIQVFACDHRRNVCWNLPYVRFGGVESECAIKCENKIGYHPVNADETPKIYWLWKNTDQLGADYIGYCQYRRFFANATVYAPDGHTVLPLLNITASTFSNAKDIAMTPMQQLSVIMHANADGILHPAIKLIDDKRISYEFIWEQLEIMTRDDILPYGWHKRVFQMLLDNTPAELKDAMQDAFSEKSNYLCNIFTCKRTLFKQFGEIAFKTAEQILAKMNDEKVDKKMLHPYWLAYVFERFTSCYFHAMQKAGNKFVKMPLVCVDAHSHIRWQKPDQQGAEDA